MRWRGASGYGVTLGLLAVGVLVPGVAAAPEAALAGPDPVTSTPAAVAVVPMTVTASTTATTPTTVTASTTATTPTTVTAVAGRSLTSARVRTGGAPLHIRTNASTWNPPVGRLDNGAGMRVSCQLTGETVAGAVRTTSMWVRIGSRQYVSDGYVRWVGGRPDVPWCDMRVKLAPESKSGFIRFAARRAHASWRDYQVPRSVSIAQAINESGWGRSSLTRQGNAYFGIKCFGTPGPVATGCRPYRTSECDRSGCGPTVASFRVYHLASRSFLDHGRFLRVNPRYRAAFDHTDNPDRFAREIHRAGYATDPHYGDKIISLMRQYNLYRYDR